MWLSATRRWADGRKALLGRAHRNVAIVAFANKLARIAWAVLGGAGERFLLLKLNAGDVVEDRRGGRSTASEEFAERVTTRWPR